MRNKIISIVGTFIVFGCLYMLIEIAFRGYTSWTMGVLAGIIAVFIGALNQIFTYDMDLFYQVIVATIFATLAEGVAGIILNVILGLGIWDYSNLGGTFFFGQCNVLFCVAWLGLSLVCIVLQDCLLYYVLRTEKERPYYIVYGRSFYLPQRKVKVI